MENQIAKIEHDQRKDQQQRIAELKVQLQKNEEEDAVMEKDVEILKRKAVRESEREKWEAIREASTTIATSVPEVNANPSIQYAEKLSMVAQAALSIVPSLPSVPPSTSQPYQGENTTASVRASLQNALDHYSPGNIGLIVANPTPADLKHTRSFGVTHAQELSRIGSTDEPSTNVPTTPPSTSATAPPPAPSSNIALPPSPTIAYSGVSPASPLSKVVPSARSPPRSPASVPHPGTTSPPLNPANLNQAPAPIPIPAASTSPIVAPNPSDPTIKVPSVTPTVAETGVPKVAGPDGPGPASGSLLNKRASPPPTTSPVAALPPPRFPTAEDEKKRLEREERERLLHGEATSGPTSGSGFESAEEEKKRLEREERERVLRGNNADAPQHPPGEDDGELPPYQEF